MGVGSRGKRLKRGFVFGTVEIKEFSGYRGIALCPENFVSVSAKKQFCKKKDYILFTASIANAERTHSSADRVI